MVDLVFRNEHVREPIQRRALHERRPQLCAGAVDGEVAGPAAVEDDYLVIDLSPAQPLYPKAEVMDDGRVWCPRPWRGRIAP